MRTHAAAGPSPGVRTPKGPAPRPAQAPRTAVDDQETRQRLLISAERLFADRGFKKVTVREICRAARANVAAINYHFGARSWWRSGRKLKIGSKAGRCICSSH